MARVHGAEMKRRSSHELSGLEGKTFVSAFTQALADLGWTDGRNVRMDLRWGGNDTNRIQALAQELVGLQPDIILASGTPATVALQRETRTIPIVFANVADPVASGLVPRLNQPGGNVTGFALYEPTLPGKWLELLTEIAPDLKRAAIMIRLELPLFPPSLGLLNSSVGLMAAMCGSTFVGRPLMLN